MTIEPALFWTCVALFFLVLTALIITGQQLLKAGKARGKEVEDLNRFHNRQREEDEQVRNLLAVIAVTPLLKKWRSASPRENRPAHKHDAVVLDFNTEDGTVVLCLVSDDYVQLVFGTEERPISADLTQFPEQRVIVKEILEHHKVTRKSKAARAAHAARLMGNLEPRP